MRDQKSELHYSDRLSINYKKTESKKMHNLLKLKKDE